MHPVPESIFIPRKCPICGADLKPRQRYCSDRCRLRAYRIRQVNRIVERIRRELIKEIVR
ncbi:MAG: DUF2116 family Zn-ribbon domain-containing protein [Syntrophales bacterium]